VTHLTHGEVCFFLSERGGGGPPPAHAHGSEASAPADPKLVHEMQSYGIQAACPGTGRTEGNGTADTRVKGRVARGRPRARVLSAG